MKKGCWLGWVVMLLFGGQAWALETIAYRFVEKPDLHPYSPGQSIPFSAEMSPEPPVLEKTFRSRRVLWTTGTSCWM